MGASANNSLISDAQTSSAVSVDWNRSKGRNMNLSNIGVALCIAAAVTSISAYAGDHRKESRDDRHHASAMQAVTVAAKVGEPGHRWRYFSDSLRNRAVVISPSGDYYYSRGKGLELVFKASAAA